MDVTILARTPIQMITRKLEHWNILQKRGDGITIGI
jgi:hypothetical protein